MIDQVDYLSYQHHPSNPKLCMASIVTTPSFSWTHPLGILRIHKLPRERHPYYLNHYHLLLGSYILCKQSRSLGYANTQNRTSKTSSVHATQIQYS